MPTTWGVPPAEPSFSGAWRNHASVQQQTGPNQTVTDDDDIWGDFEGPTNGPTEAPTAATSASTAPWSFAQSQQASAEPVRSRVVRASTMDLISNNLVDVMSSPPKTTAVNQSQWGMSPPRTRQLKEQKQSDPNVLFDADDFEGVEEDVDDEFGDFETGSGMPATSPPAKAEVDLLGLSMDPEPAVIPQAAPSNAPPSLLMAGLTISSPVSSAPAPQYPAFPPAQSRPAAPGLNLSSKNAILPTHKQTESSSPLSSKHVTPPPKIDRFIKPPTPKADDGDAWGSFDDFQSPQPSGQPTTKTVTNAATTSAATKSATKAATTSATTKPAAKPALPKTQAAKPPKPATLSDWDWGDEDTTTTPSAPTVALPGPVPHDVDKEPPPTNIPPPAILLPAFPPLLAQATTFLFQPLSAAPTSAAKTLVLSSPKTREFLRAHLAIATVAARILAGRRLRWQRDTFLAKAMSISASGAKGGMRLGASVDRKTQTAHEDREAEEVVAAWRAQVGRLRDVVAGANAAAAGKGGSGRQGGVDPGPPMRVPELATEMAVTTAPPGSAIQAPKPCALCGLKRDERVGRVDFDVEDSFGEWWVEHWGHRTCRNWWREHEASLRQR